MMAAGWVAGAFTGLAVALACLLTIRHLMRLYRRRRRLFKQEVGHRLADAFLFVNTGRLWQARWVLCGLAGLLAWLLTGHPGWVGVAALGAWWGPRSAARYMAGRRIRHLEAQLPGFLHALAAALRAGAGIQTALQRLSTTLEAPLGQELRLVLREQRMGRTQEQALQAWARRVPIEGVWLFVCSVLLATRQGGGLADMLDRVAATVEARVRLAARVRALTAQGRLQAIVMALLPLALAAVLQALDPRAMWPLWHTPAGWRILVLVGALELVGIWLIRRIVRLDI